MHPASLDIQFVGHEVWEVSLVMRYHNKLRSLHAKVGGELPHFPPIYLIKTLKWLIQKQSISGLITAALHPPWPTEPGAPGHTIAWKYAR